jgi:dihydrofolate synthase/folylpolyglutamate synthase
MLTSKDPLAFLRHLAPVAEDLSAIGIPGDHASFAVADAVGFARQAGLPAEGYGSTAAALAAIVARHGTAPRRVLICGSLYLAGTVLADNG